MTDEPQVVHLIRQIKPDGVIHLAGVTHASDLHSYFRSNVLGCANLLKGSVACGKRPRIIVVGTAAQYDFSAGNGQPVTEQSPLACTEPYGLSKNLQEKWALMYAQREGLPLCCVRIFNILGPGQPPTLVPATFLRQLLQTRQSKRPAIRVGDTSTERDFVDVRDVARAIVKLLTCDRFAAGECFNIASGGTVKVGQILRACLALAGQPNIPVIADPGRTKAADTRTAAADISKLKGWIDWQPEIHWRESVKDMWLQSNHST
jgi:GDP-4-dehydro-6-deoxy-D-mannose reductase